MMPKPCDYKGCLELAEGLYKVYDNEHYCEMKYCGTHATKILMEEQNDIRLIKKLKNPFKEEVKA